MVLHGHGLVERQQRGPAAPGQEAVCAVIFVRRYLCTACDTVMRVLPGSSVARKHFSGAAIALALALWGLCGKSAREVIDALVIAGANALFPERGTSLSGNADVMVTAAVTSPRAVLTGNFASEELQKPA